MESLVELLRSRVVAAPDATALVADGKQLSYAELDLATDRAAARLAAAGVRQGELTGLLVERDAETVIWLLAILKHGAAYLPLDPEYPRERIEYIVEDSQLSFVVGARPTAERVGLADQRLIDRAGTEAEPVGAGNPGPRPALCPDSTAYAIYTSGSTGKPKGCVITHGNVLALLEAGLPKFDFTPDDRWAIFHSLCFDVSVWELWGALATGATAVIVPLEKALSPVDFVSFLQQQRVTVLHQVPSVFRYTVKAHALSSHPQLSLRYVLLAGESVNLDVIRDYLDGAGEHPPTMVNMYGISETTVYSLIKVLDPATLASDRTSPLGGPLPHVGAYVLDDERQLVTDGSPGELWLSGPSLSNGYLHRDDLTKERFVELPVGSGPELVRCYRTGDVVRQLPDGELEFLGRNDDQIKIRGFRIELPEIETVLTSHPEVFDAAVCVVEAPSGPALAACVVCVGDYSDKHAESFKELLKSTLPVHMVPRLYLAVDRLPQTPSGKLDRPAVAKLFSDLTARPPAKASGAPAGAPG